MIPTVREREQRLNTYRGFTMVNTIVIEAAAQATLKLYIQGEASEGVGGCAYRSDMGACLVGHMVKDEHYDFDMEGENCASVLVTAIISNSLEIVLSSHDTDLLMWLQDKLHDRYTLKRSQLGTLKEFIIAQLKGVYLKEYPLFTERALKLIEEYNND